VGRTGAGKSTLVKLLWRSMLMREGRILIDDQDITKMDLKLMRKQINIVS
jgi:ABC-type multidrug transport system fused ATPase/permease subunit